MILKIRLLYLNAKIEGRENEFSGGGGLVVTLYYDILKTFILDCFTLRKWGRWVVPQRR
jgi:hypothetical protein